MLPKVIFVPRSEWGASATTEQFIRNRVKDSALIKDEIHIHHTAGIDVDDNTPNRWDYDEAVAYMKRLQWSRPDLGPLPYSENYAVSEDLSTVWVFEGRGWDVRGAHTANHNVRGVGLGVFGNFDKYDIAAAKTLLYAIELRVAEKRKNGYPNLGKAKNPKGWNAWGHRDTSSKTCPGHSLYPLLGSFKLDREEEDDMAILTDDEQRRLQRFLNELDKIESDENFVRFMIPWFRKWRNFLPEHFARAGSGGTLPKEEVVRLIRE